MAVKIRLRRVGAKKQPAYRLVVANSTAPRDGRFIEIIGHYNPLTATATVVIDNDRALYWLRHGALPTDVVKKMFVKKGIWAVFTGEAPESSLAAPVEEAPAPVIETAPEVAVETAPEEAVEEAAAPEAEAPAEEVVEAASETVEDE